jgi:TolB-like protein
MNPSRLAALWAYLKDDVAFRVATIYAGASWFLIEAADTLGARPSSIRTFALALIAAFVILVPVVWLMSRRRAASRAESEADLHWGSGGHAAKPAPRPGTRRWVTGLIALVLIASGLWAYRAKAGALPPAAERLAVLPFHATGSAEVREFGVGMVDLLTAALSDVGGIRTVASRSVLARVRAADTDLTEETALAIGRDLGAGSVLTGSVTSFGANVRLTAELREVTKGGLLAAAEVQGPQDAILDLTDQLAVGLLRELWRSRAPMPTVRVAALTTSSPVALRAYLRGEQHLRALRFDSAADHFRAALATDSLFAIAWARLAEATGWAGGGEEDLVTRRQYVARALELGDRLPDRERALVRAVDLHLRGSFAAFDSIDSYVRRYPDDPMGWYHLGDTRFHSAYLGRLDDEEIIRPFIESVRLDPALGMGLEHVLDMHRNRGDRAAFDSALVLYARVAPPRRVERFRMQAAVRWAAPDSVVAAFVGAIRRLHPVEDRWLLNGLIAALGPRARLDPNVDPMVHPVALDSLRRIHANDPEWQRRATFLRFLSLAAFGRAEEAFAELDRELALDPPNLPPIPRHLIRASWRTGHAAAGELPVDAVRGDARLVEQNINAAPWFPNVLHGYYLATGDIERARKAPINFDVPPPPNTRPVDREALSGSFKGWVALLRGDTAGGLAQMEESLERLGYVDAHYVGVPWREVGKILSHIPERRRQGIRMLRWSILFEAEGTGDSYLALARALETEADREGARAAYAHVLRLWEGADPYRQAAYTDAKQALIRLTAEPQ